MANDADVPPSLKSGRTGGAATGAGVDFQTQYAVYVALRMIIRIFRDSPLQRPMLVIEPRLLTDQAVTRWDLQLAPDGVATEAKLRPSKGDLREFLQRCRQSVQTGSSLRFEIVFGEGGTPLLSATEKLVRLAKESAGDIDRFRQLSDLEMEDHLQEVLAVLGPEAQTVGLRLALKCFPEHLLSDAIETQLQFLVSPSQRTHARDSLYALFVAGMRERKTFFIPHLLQQLKDNGIRFVDAGRITPENIDPILHKAVFLLQHCKQGVPHDVLAACVSCDEGNLTQLIDETQAAVRTVDDLWIVSPLPNRLDHPDGSQILARALDTLLEFIRANRSNQSGLQQVVNATALVRACRAVNPAAAMKAFGPLDKLLKRGGNKHLVLEISKITVEAARAVSPPTEEARRAEAKALICGAAWVYQRIGRFDEAESAAAESLRIGQSLSWERNTAFCLKCIGRLRRVRAEQELHARRRSKLLGESRDHLLQAIEAFSTCGEFGPNDAEVGDCHSLLARTELLSGRVSEACSHAERARELITSFPGFEDSKDYMDMLILEGEILAKQLDYSGADKKFVEALSCLTPQDAEKSEIAARAHFARGQNRLRWKQDKAGAIDEMRSAGRIWDGLGEHFYRGLAAWTVIETEGEVSRRDVQRLRMVLPSVRVEMIRLLQLQRRSHSARTLSQRAELNDSAWKELVSQAKKNDEIRNSRW